ncbi:unnamed protein product [Brassica rapa]|uniref:Vesicle transport protein n=1 Tax=Brassica campestris TaxID=3711 RepID=A0A8D9GS59_BRACM|nr:unnamed protein product [Brassica rapa]
MLPSPLIALHFKRMYGFAASLAAGLLLMFLVMINFTYPMTLTLFFFFGSTVFLMGPEQQINMMFVSTLPLSMSDASFLHSFCALLIHSKILTVIAILCKTCALMWYSLSYIPFTRRMVSEIMICLCDNEL